MIDWVKCESIYMSYSICFLCLIFHEQATNNIPSSSMLIPGFYDCLNQCFISSTTPPVVLPPPVNNYSLFGNNPMRGPQLELGSLGQDYREWQQAMQLHNSLAPVRRCANCHITDTPMWRRGPGGPKVILFSY